MSTPLENLQTVKQQLTDQLVDLTLNPKPTYSVDGQSVQWESFQRMLTDQLEKVNELINLLDPYELSTLMT